jgi:hypothetical protein
MNQICAVAADFTLPMLVARCQGNQVAYQKPLATLFVIVLDDGKDTIGL